MKYALSLDSNKRILSAWTVLSIGDYDGMPKVETLPDGDITDYLYVDGVYVYEPLPEPEPIVEEPTADEILNALLGVE